MKRFTENTKWMDPWFMELAPGDKLFWHYLCDTCDCAGVWKVNWRLAEFQTGLKLDPKETFSTFRARVEPLPGGYWWIRKFVVFQYGTLSERCIPHKKVIESLKQHGLLGRINGSERP